MLPRGKLNNIESKITEAVINNEIRHKESSYCLKWKKIQNINRVLRTKNDKTMILLKCAKCGSKKSRFSKNKKQAEY